VLQFWLVLDRKLRTADHSEQRQFAKA